MLKIGSSVPRCPMVNLYRTLIKVAGSYAPQLQRSLGLSLLASIIQGCTLALLFPLLDALASFQEQLPGRLLVLMAGGTVLEALLRWRELDFGWRTSIEVTHELRIRLGEQLRQMPQEDLNRYQSGDLNLILSSDVADLVLWMGSIVSLILQAIVVPSTLVLVTLWVDWRLAIALLITLPGAIPFYRQLRRHAATEMPQMAQADAIATSRLIEYVQGLPVLRAHQQVGQQSDRLQAALQHQRQIQIDSQDRTTRPTLLLAGMVQASLCLILSLGISLVWLQDLKISTLMAIIVIVVCCSDPLTYLAGLTTLFDLMESALERVEHLMAICPLPVAPKPKIITDYTITFDHVYFRYRGQENWILNDVSLELPERSFTALVGPSGSGKTTIARLISRYADPQSGTLAMGGVNLQTLSPAILMPHLAAVFQDVYLFNDTIYNNIRMAKPVASDADVIAAAKIANCHGLIQRFPQGYHTRVGEVGGALSGGERQRISIARAILKDAPIILLDEPTSALDAESEVLVQHAIDRLVADKTVVVIAHRLSTIVGADQILVVQAGKIIERGTHSELLNQKGAYSQMWWSQQPQ
ncbi:ABC transporter, transmembrane region (plasmid) [Acaryochloris marina MBIC11017]|uniref:ABC transporter, transmembrane region n=1 Tax=Acaryochloris marina (strain MBIC 11017) TaxID=329726 RepID=A8ZKI0_ACAM1|nr:ABC transporter, transmembrane region [Acaryochloris marina MBIC11017]